MARRAALYIHLVVDDPAALAERRVQLSEYAQAQGYEIALAATDTGPSGELDRPGLQQILAAAEAGEFDVLMMLDPWELHEDLVQNLGQLWGNATLEEQRDLTRVLLKAVFVDVPNDRIVAIEPVPIFRQLFTEFCRDIGVAIL